MIDSALLAAWISPSPQPSLQPPSPSLASELDLSRNLFGKLVPSAHLQPITERGVDRTTCYDDDEECLTEDVECASLVPYPFVRRRSTTVRTGPLRYADPDWPLLIESQNASHSTKLSVCALERVAIRASVTTGRLELHAAHRWFCPDAPLYRTALAFPTFENGLAGCLPSRPANPVIVQHCLDMLLSATSFNSRLISSISSERQFALPAHMYGNRTGLDQSSDLMVFDMHVRRFGLRSGNPLVQHSSHFRINATEGTSAQSLLQTVSNLASALAQLDQFCTDHLNVSDSNGSAPQNPMLKNRTHTVCGKTGALVTTFAEVLRFLLRRITEFCLALKAEASRTPKKKAPVSSCASASNSLFVSLATPSPAYQVRSARGLSHHFSNNLGQTDNQQHPDVEAIGWPRSLNELLNHSLPSLTSPNVSDQNSLLTLLRLNNILDVRCGAVVRVLQDVISQYQHTTKTDQNAARFQSTALLNVLYGLCSQYQRCGQAEHYELSFVLLIQILVPYLDSLDCYVTQVPKSASLLDYQLVQDGSLQTQWSHSEFWEKCYQLTPSQNIPVFLKPFSALLLDTVKAHHVLRHFPPSSQQQQQPCIPASELVQKQQSLVWPSKSSVKPTLAHQSISRVVSFRKTKTLPMIFDEEKALMSSCRKIESYEPLLIEFLKMCITPAIPQPSPSECILPSCEVRLGAKHWPDILAWVVSPNLPNNVSQGYGVIVDPSKLTTPINHFPELQDFESELFSSTLNDLLGISEPSGFQTNTSVHDKETRDASSDISYRLQAPDLRVPLSVSLDVVLGSIIRRNHALVNSVVMNMLFREQHLLHYFVAIQRYWCLQRGDVVSTFTRFVFDALLREGTATSESSEITRTHPTNDDWRNSKILTLALHHAISDAGTCPIVNELETLIVEYREASSQQAIPAFPSALRSESVVSALSASASHVNPSSAPLPSCCSVDCLASIGLRMAVPAPLNVILHDGMMAQYDAVFTILLKLHFTKYRLDNIGDRSITNAVAGRPYMMVAPFFHKMFLLRGRMLFMVNGIIHYTMTRITILWEKFMHDIQGCSDVGKARDMHTAMVQTLQNACLLSSIQAQQKIAGIVQLVHHPL